MFVTRNEKSVRPAAVQALGVSGTSQAVRVVDILCRSKDPEIRAAAENAAQQIRAQQGFKEPPPPNSKKQPAETP